MWFLIRILIGIVTLQMSIAGSAYCSDAKSADAQKLDLICDFINSNSTRTSRLYPEVGHSIFEKKLGTSKSIKLKGGFAYPVSKEEYILGEWTVKNNGDGTWHCYHIQASPFREKTYSYKIRASDKVKLLEARIDDLQK